MCTGIFTWEIWESKGPPPQEIAGLRRLLKAYSWVLLNNPLDSNDIWWPMAHMIDTPRSLIYSP